MKRTSDKPSHISQEDWDAVDMPEATDEEWSRAVPFKDAHPEVYSEWKRGRGRPKVEQPNVYVGFRLAADLANGIKATGKGYNARVGQVLREALGEGPVMRERYPLFGRIGVVSERRRAVPLLGGAVGRHRHRHRAPDDCGAGRLGGRGARPVPHLHGGRPGTQESA